MNNTLIVITAYRSPSDATHESAVACQPAAVMKVKGSPYIERSRNQAFEQTSDVFETHPQLDMVIYLDDDIVIARPVDMQRLVDTTRITQHPRSARYVTAHGQLAGTQYPGNPNRWAFGLGCMAVPRQCLLNLKPKLPMLGERQWCQNGAHPVWPDQWVGEDLQWCAHFGGVDLDPMITVGHMKPMILFPAGPNGGVRAIPA